MMAQAARVREIKRIESLAKTEEAAANQAWSRFYKQAWFWCSLSLLFWLVVGTTFYMVWHEVAMGALQRGCTHGAPHGLRGLRCETADVDLASTG